MRKVFPLTAPGQEPERVVAAVKNDVRKYIKRERRKALPEGADFWDFDCRVGPERDAPRVSHVAELTAVIDNAAAEGWPTLYIELLAKPGHRTRKQ